MTAIGVGEARPATALRAVRARLALVALLLALAVAAWWLTVHQMAGMDASPGAELGALGWFVGVWVAMMAAMMLPSVSPTVALYARMAKSRLLAPLVFATGYFVAWTTIGLAVYLLSDAGRWVLGPELAWHRAGRFVAGGTIVVAALYEVTPLKDVCLQKCRSPLGFLLGSWRRGLGGALQMGTRHGCWCIGCCWALMASLFALGVMSLAAMGFIAALIAAEKLLPWGRAVTYSTAALLLVLGVAVAVAPDAVPGLTVPGTHGGGSMMMK